MLSVRPKIAEVVFQLYGRSLHPELFVIQSEQKIARGDYNATIQITNTGHVVTFQDGGLILSEVTTSASQMLPEMRRLMSYRLQGERKDRIECRGGVVYETTFSLDRVDPSVFAAYHQEMELTGPKHGMMYKFESSGRFDLGAVSYIHVDSRDKSMCVQAVHTFPDDYAIVKTQSIFKLPSRKS